MIKYESHPRFSIYLRPSVQQQGNHVGVASFGGHMERCYPILTRQPRIQRKDYYSQNTILFTWEKYNSRQGLGADLIQIPFQSLITLRII